MHTYVQTCMHAHTCKTKKHAHTRACLRSNHFGNMQTFSAVWKTTQPSGTTLFISIANEHPEKSLFGKHRLRRNAWFFTFLLTQSFGSLYFLLGFYNRQAHKYISIRHVNPESKFLPTTFAHEPVFGIPTFRLILYIISSIPVPFFHSRLTAGKILQGCNPA